jgi:hypothetical protein
MVAACPKAKDGFSSRFPVVGDLGLLDHGKYFVPILYRMLAFDAFDDFSDFVESITCEPSESCQVRGSNPCRGATTSVFELPTRFVDSILADTQRTISLTFCELLSVMPFLQAQE